MTWKRTWRNGKNTSASKNAQPSDTEESMTEPLLRRARSHDIIGSGCNGRSEDVDVMERSRRHSTSLTDSELNMAKDARQELLKAWWDDFLLETEPPAEDGDIDAISDLVQEDGGVDYAERISLIKHLNISSTHEKSLTLTSVTYIKSMIGTYVLYLPRLFSLGGYIFAPVFLVIISAASLYNMLLLLRCRNFCGAQTFGEVGACSYGLLGKRAVDMSIFLSQSSFCVSYFVFVCNNLRDVTGINTMYLIILQLFAYIPLSWVRKIKYLGPGVFLSQFGVMLILTLILGYIFTVLSEDGLSRDLTPYRKDTALMCIGAAVSYFEGIGLVLPIEQSMHPADKHRYPTLLCWCTVGITAFSLLLGLSGYLAFGSSVEPFITMELGGNGLGVTSRAIYSAAMILSYPLQIFPAIRIMERWVWEPSLPEILDLKKRKSTVMYFRRKVAKNTLRTVLVVCTAGVSLAAGRDYDMFLAFVGSLCALPLALIYPVMFHLKFFWNQKGLALKKFHIFLVICGITASITTVITSLILSV
eukprot:532104_1